MPVNSFIDYPMSWKPDRSRLKRPVYLSLARKLEEDILTGELAPGTKLPPQRELADYLDINFTTVTRAYKLCEEKGLLYGKTGSGTFVAPSTIRDHTISLIHSGGSIDLALVASFEQCNHMVKNAAKKAAGKSFSGGFLKEKAPPWGRWRLPLSQPSLAFLQGIVDDRQWIFHKSDGPTSIFQQVSRSDLEIECTVRFRSRNHAIARLKGQIVCRTYTEGQC